MIGHVRFHSRPETSGLQNYGLNAVEIGVRILEPFRKCGHATEAMTALMDWATRLFGVHHFVVSVSPDNMPSLRLTERLRFVKVGETVDEVDGVEHVFLRKADPVQAVSSSTRG